MLTSIIFTYNHENSIAKCIDSILEQKTTYPYEIHIWDDCSTDKTSEICRKYAAQYPDKIKLTVQKKNTFCGPYLEMQSLAAIKAIKTPYFCIIDGDDYWCDESKIQIALDFLEAHPEYNGFAHDTLQVEVGNNTERSYIHDSLKIDTIKNPVTFSAKAPFFLTSSRIFRTGDYADKNILPIDYLFYYYHLSQGPIYYYDKIMAAYVVGENSTFAIQGTKMIQYLNSMFAYKLFLLFGIKEDKFCTEMQLKYGNTCGIGDKYYKKLQIAKKIFGVNWGWKIFMYTNFMPKFGRDCLNINYIYANRALVKKVADERVNDKQNLVKNKEKSQEELIRFMHQMEILYQKNKTVFISASAVIKIFDKVALTAIGLNEFQTIALLEKKYPEFREYIFKEYRTYKSVYPREKSKLKKYKKRYQRLLVTSILLLFTTIVSCAVLWSKI